MGRPGARFGLALAELSSMKYLLAILLSLFTLATHADSGWPFEAGGRVSANPLAHAGLIYICAGQRLSVVDRKGQLQWSVDLGAATYSSAAIGEEKVFVLAENGLHAFSLSGESLWHFKTTDGPLQVDGTTMGWGSGAFTDPWAWYRSSPLPVGDQVVFGTHQGTFAVDAVNGEQRWLAKTGVTHTRPAQHEGLVLVGSWDNHLYGLKQENGATAWKFEARLPAGEMAGWLGWEGFHLDPALDEGVIYAGSRGTYFYAVNAANGVEKWSAKHPTSWIGSPAIVNNGVIYFGTSDGNSLIGLETRAGNQVMLFRNNFYNFARPQANESHVFMASVSGELFAIDKRSGSGRRIFATPSSRTNLPELLSPNGGLEYLYSKEGYTHENASRDVFRMLEKLDSLLSLTLDGEMLYAGSANGRVYAIAVP